MAAYQTSSVGDAFAWAGRIMAVGFIMVLPGVGGSWLDDNLGTRYCEPIGFVIGFTIGLTSLIRMTVFRGPQPPPDSSAP